jgi:hypothetical protein
LKVNLLPFTGKRFVQIAKGWNDSFIECTAEGGGGKALRNRVKLLD